MASLVQSPNQRAQAVSAPVAADIKVDRSQVALGATPTSTVAKNIENAIVSLKPGEQIFVDSRGAIHAEKAPFLNGGPSLPLVSFTKPNFSNDTIVHAGVPSRHPTYCRPGQAMGKRDNLPVHLEREAVPLRYATTLSSGDRISLGLMCELQVPNRHISSPETSSEKLAQLLAQAQPGDTVQLGRQAVPACHGSVSRIHCTVEILSKEDRDDGTFSMKVRVFPGMPGVGSISIERPDGAREPILDNRAVAPGERVSLGDAFGVIKIPHPPESVGEISESITGTFLTGRRDRAQEALQSFLGPDRGEFSRDVMGRERLDHSNRAKLLYANVLQNYVCAGLSLIREGKFDLAVDHYRTPEMLEMCGYRFEENNVFILGSLTPEAVLQNIHEVGGRSWFKPMEKLVYPSFAMLKPGLEPSTDAERKLVHRWQQEIALIYAEEYTHALQNLLGSKPVSRKAALLPSPDLEADVALFFHEQGVAISRDFVVNRYEERQEALRLAKGFQTEETQELFSEALLEAPLGGKVLVGKDTAKAAASHGYAHSFTVPRPNSLKSQEPAFGIGPRLAYSLLAPAEVIIEKRVEGNFMVSPFDAAFSLVFVPDSAGFYRRISDPEIVEPGTPIYLGRSFRLVL